MLTIKPKNLYVIPITRIPSNSIWTELKKKKTICNIFYRKNLFFSIWLFHWMKTKRQKYLNFPGIRLTICCFFYLFSFFTPVFFCSFSFVFTFFFSYCSIPIDQPSIIVAIIIIVVGIFLLSKAYRKFVCVKRGSVSVFLCLCLMPIHAYKC